jgi:hypothetical protein
MPSRASKAAAQGEWLAAGATDCLQWVFPSVTGTPLDASNVRKALNRILLPGELHERGRCKRLHLGDRRRSGVMIAPIRLACLLRSNAILPVSIP